jgi:uncharacterized repeat protein (TIGR01451 family)
MKYSTFALMIMIATVILIPVFTVQAAILYVDAGLTAGLNNGTSWPNAYQGKKGLSKALSAAKSGDQIWVAQGIYKPDTADSDSRKATFQLKNGVAVYGGFENGDNDLSRRNPLTNPAVLSGDLDSNDKDKDKDGIIEADDITGANSYHVVTAGGTDISAVLDGFIITAGNADSTAYPDNSGGGILNIDGSPTISRVTFIGNSASGNGGGMFNRAQNGDCSPAITHVLFMGNAASNGGGMYNQAQNRDCSPTVRQAVFSGNFASDSGGGICNRAQNSDCNTVISHGTFSGNSASQGGGMFSRSINGTCMPTVTNSIFWKNSSEITDDGSVTTVYYSIVQDGWDGAGASTSDTDPMFVRPVNPATAPSIAGDLHLKSGSPAVDGADNATTVATDVEGNPRKADGDSNGSAVADMGAYERQPADGPEIQVFYNETEIADNTAQPIDLGVLPLGTRTLCTIVIHNAGTDDLTLTNLTVNGSALPVGRISLDDLFPGTVAPDDSDFFTLDINTDEPGDFQYTLSFHTNDSDETPFNFPIKGKVVPLILSLLADSYSFGEGDSGATIKVSLSAAQNADLTVGFTLSGTADLADDYELAPGSNIGTLDTAAGTLTVTKGATAGLIRIKPVDDFIDEENETVEVSLKAGTAYSVGENGNLRLTLADNDLVSVVLSSNKVDVTEGEGGAEYKIRLSTLPDDVVTVDFETGDEILPIESITFSPDDPATLWSKDQAVSVKDMDDSDPEGPHTQLIIHHVSGGGYDGISVPNVTVNITDNDVSYELSADTPFLKEGNEGSQSVTFPIIRTGDTTRPSSVAFVCEGTADADADYTLVGVTGGGVSESDGVISFEANAEMAVITVDILGDEIADEGAETVQIALGNAKGTNDRGTGIITGSPAITTITDDDTPGVIILETGDSTEITESGPTDTYSVALNTAPQGYVKIVISPDAQTDVSIDGGNSFGGPGSSVSLTLSNTNPQTVTVRAADDAAAQGEHTGMITHAVTKAVDAPGYSTMTDIPDITVRIIDNDTPGVFVSSSSLEIPESAGAVSFRISLNTRPAGMANVKIPLKILGECSIPVDSVTIENGNWAMGETVFVSVTDDDADNPRNYRTCTVVTGDPVSTDSDYNGAAHNPPDVTITVADDDTAGFAISRISSSTNEDGTTVKFTLGLTSEPADDVTISLSSSDLSEGVVSPAYLNFSACNWMPQTVIVTGVDDLEADGNIRYSIITEPDIFTTDDHYGNMDPPDISLVNIDDEILWINEGPSDIFLSNFTVDENAPAGTVVGTLSADDPDTEDVHAFFRTVGTEGWADNDWFLIDGDLLKTAAVLDYEAGTSYKVHIGVTDMGGESYFKTFAIGVNDLSEVAQDIILTYRWTDERLPIGNVLGIFTSTGDPDTDDAQTYTLVSGDGDTDNGLFSIDGNMLKTGAILDYNTKSVCHIRIRSTDKDGLTFEKAFTLTPNISNVSPSDILLSNTAIDENMPKGDVVGTFSATDENTGDRHTYFLIPGEGSIGNSGFSITGNSLRTAYSPDYEKKSRYDIRVLADDGKGGTFIKNFAITVNDVNDAPSLSEIKDITLRPSDSDDQFATIDFRVYDQDTPISGLKYYGKSSVPELLPDHNIRFGGSGISRKIFLTPEPGISGSAIVTLTVSDGELMTARNFIFNVIRGAIFDQVHIGADIDPYEPVFAGDILSYTAIIPNTGDRDVSGISLGIPIPRHTVYVEGSLKIENGHGTDSGISAPEYSSSLNEILWDGDLAAGSEIRISFDVLTDASLEAGDAIIGDPAFLDYDSDGDMLNDTMLELDKTVPVVISAPDCLRGDADGDGLTDLRDAMRVLKELAGIKTGEVRSCMEVNADARVGIEEAVYILRRE